MTEAEMYHQLTRWTLEDRDRLAIEQANEALRKAMEGKHESQPR